MGFSLLKADQRHQTAQTMLGSRRKGEDARRVVVGAKEAAGGDEEHEPYSFDAL
jgi:hypothetical protein